MSRNVQHCKKAMEFFIQFDAGSKAFLSYKKLPNKTLDFVHTVTPQEQQGKGIAKLLVKEGLRYAKENEYKIKPTCWYVEKYINEMATEDEKQLSINYKSSL